MENSWIRSGDDLFEVKATNSSAPNAQTGGSNITFRHNQAWAEKTRSFGFIQESLMDVDGLLFEDCSSILQVATMYNAMGAFLVVVGDASTVRNVTFRNCDSYYCQGFVMNVMVGPNYWSASDDWGTIENITFDGIRYYNDFSGETVSVMDGLEVSPYTQGIQISNRDTRPRRYGKVRRRFGAAEHHLFQYRAGWEKSHRIGPTSHRICRHECRPEPRAADRLNRCVRARNLMNEKSGSCQYSSPLFCRFGTDRSIFACAMRDINRPCWLSTQGSYF